jgi:hypothetical protein
MPERRSVVAHVGRLAGVAALLAAVPATLLRAQAPVDGPEIARFEDFDFRREPVTAEMLAELRRPEYVRGLPFRTIAAVEARVHESLSSQPLDSAMLTSLFLEDARKLRNEIYARHGRVFKDPWLQAYFSSLPWYRPNPAFRDDQLTARPASLFPHPASSFHGA